MFLFGPNQGAFGDGDGGGGSDVTLELLYALAGAQSSAGGLNQLESSTFRSEAFNDISELLLNTNCTAEGTSMVALGGGGSIVSEPFPLDFVPTAVIPVALSSGPTDIVSIDISLDGGKTWQVILPAAFGTSVAITAPVPALGAATVAAHAVVLDEFAPSLSNAFLVDGFSYTEA